MRTDVPQVSPAPIAVSAQLVTWRESEASGAQAFVKALEGFAQRHGVDALRKFPEIAHWLAP